jgi:hypothetical protein
MSAFTNVRCAMCRSMYMRTAGADPGCPRGCVAAVTVLPGQLSLLPMATANQHDGSTRVVNLRKEPCDRYIGRSGNGKPVHLCEPGEAGYFGNPHPVSKSGTLALPFFRRYLRERLARDDAFRSEVQGLRGQRLGCFCAPGPCHGDVYVEWLTTGDIRVDVREAEAPDVPQAV